MPMLGARAVARHDQSLPALPANDVVTDVPAVGVPGILTAPHDGFQATLPGNAAVTDSSASPSLSYGEVVTDGDVVDVRRQMPKHKHDRFRGRLRFDYSVGLEPGRYASPSAARPCECSGRGVE